MSRNAVAWTHRPRSAATVSVAATMFQKWTQDKLQVLDTHTPERLLAGVIRDGQVLVTVSGRLNCQNDIAWPRAKVYINNSPCWVPSPVDDHTRHVATTTERSKRIRIDHAAYGTADRCRERGTEAACKRCRSPPDAGVRYRPRPVVRILVELGDELLPSVGHVRVLPRRVAVLVSCAIGIRAYLLASTQHSRLLTSQMIVYPIQALLHMLLLGVFSELASAYPVAGAMATWSWRSARAGVRKERQWGWLVSGLVLAAHLGRVRHPCLRTAQH